MEKSSLRKKSDPVEGQPSLLNPASQISRSDTKHLVKKSSLQQKQFLLNKLESEEEEWDEVDEYEMEEELPRESATVLMIQSESEQEQESEVETDLPEYSAKSAVAVPDKSNPDIEDWNSDEPQYGLHANAVEWKVPNEGLEEAHLSLKVDGTEPEMFVHEVRDVNHTLLDKGCCSEDVLKVWTNISQYIIKMLKEGSGVRIPGLCTITCNAEKLEMDEFPEYFELVKSPVMIMSPLIVKMCKLENENYVYNGLVKSAPLNLGEIAIMSSLPRTTVEGAVTELCTAFIRAVVCNKKTEFPFVNIGKLQVRDRTACMKFYEEFYSKMGFDLPHKYGNQKSSSTASVANEKNIAAEDILPGRMTPLQKHIPSESYRSAFHLREVRSVHDGELLADPFEDKLPKCTKERRMSYAKKQKYSVVTPKIKIRHKSYISVAVGTPEEFLSDEEDEKIDHEYRWNPNTKHWEDACGEPIFYIAEPLHKFHVTGNYTIDAVTANKNLLADVLFAHHHNMCSRVLGNDAITRHYARRDRLYCQPASYEEDLYFNPPPPPPRKFTVKTNNVNPEEETADI